MIEVTYKHTETVCTTFRTISGLAAWLSTYDQGVLSPINGHPSVNVRDVRIPPWAEEDATCLIANGYYRNGRAVRP